MAGMTTPDHESLREAVAEVYRCGRYTQTDVGEYSPVDPLVFADAVLAVLRERGALIPSRVLTTDSPALP